MNDFYQLLHDPAHWAFEIFVTILFDGVLLGIFWPLVRNCWRAWRAERARREEEELTEFLKSRPTICGACEKPRLRLESSVDLCMRCGSVAVSDSKPEQPDLNQHLFSGAENREKP